MPTLVPDCVRDDVTDDVTDCVSNDISDSFSVLRRAALPQMASDRLRLPQIASDCLRWILIALDCFRPQASSIRTLTADNVASRHELATRLGSRELELACIEFVHRQRASLLADPARKGRNDSVSASDDL